MDWIQLFVNRDAGYVLVHELNDAVHVARRVRMFSKFICRLEKSVASVWSPLTVLMIAVQPGRLAERAKLVSYPYYGAVVRGAEEIVRNGDAVRSVIPPNFVNKSEPVYLVKWLGGRVDERANLIAIIGEDGRVTYQRIQDEPLK